LVAVCVSCRYVHHGGRRNTSTNLQIHGLDLDITDFLYIHTVLKDGDRFPPETFKEQLLIGANVDQ
jgi:hypothetical protein